jgi:PTH2 family peptidyl-tRNA hydrolase
VETGVTIPKETWGHYARRLLRGTGRAVVRASPVKVSLQRGPEVRILINSNVNMTRGKACAQAVHAALMAFDVPHGRVVVLGGKPEEIRQMHVQVRDAGRTEIAPGTLTAGCTLYPGDDPGDNGSS